MAEIDRLTVVFDANFKRLEDKLDKGLNKAVKASYGASAKIQKNLDGVGFKGNVTKGLQGQLDGLAKSSSIGAAGLGVLGAAGLGVTAVFAGLTLAVSETQKAMKFADDLSDQAARLNISTDALQEYQYALVKTGGAAEDAAGSIEEFDKKFGAALGQYGKRDLKPFAALGMSQAELESFGSMEEALQAVIDKIAALSNASEQAAIADKLGLSAMLPLIREGEGGFQRLADEAQALGYVMDKDLIARAGAAQDEFEVLSKVIDIQLKQAFVDLVPALLAVMQVAADVARAVSDIADSWRDLDQKTTQGLSRQIKRMEDVRDGFLAEASRLEARGAAPWEVSAKAAQASRQNVKIDELRAELRGRLVYDEPPARKPGASLVHQVPPSGGGRSRAAPRATDAEREIAAFWERLAAGNSESYKVFLDKFEKSILDEPDNQVSLLDGAADADADFKASVDEQAAYVQDSWANAIEGGIWAAMREGVPGIAEYFAQNLTQSLVESLSDNVAKFLTSQGNSSGGGWVNALLSVFTGPRHALGTSFAPGGMSLVGENGPELVNMPRGAQVIPSHAVRAMANMRAQGGGGAPIVQQFHLHAEGAVMTDQLIASLDAKAKGYAARAVAVSVQTSRKGFAATSQRQSLLGST